MRTCMGTVRFGAEVLDVTNTVGLEQSLNPKTAYRERELKKPPSDQIERHFADNSPSHGQRSPTLRSMLGDFEERVGLAYGGDPGTIGAIMIRIGLWGSLYYIHNNKGTPKLV